jgi:aryl-alcohol dehydrogenase-like predicted oxidoreductase
VLAVDIRQILAISERIGLPPRSGNRYSLCLRAKSERRRWRTVPTRRNAVTLLEKVHLADRSVALELSARHASVGGGHSRAIDASLQRLHLSRLDLLFFLHSNVVADAGHISRWPEAAARMTTYRTFVDHVRPIFESLVAEGLIGAWGLTGIGHPEIIVRLLGERPAPAAVQCIANLLDSPGGLKFFDGPARPREVMSAARASGVGIMGIRAVQAGALTAAIDRPLPEDHPEMRDFARAAGFRNLASELDVNPAVLAHRYALSLAIDTLVLGVKNRQELAECVEAAEAGPLPADLISRIDRSITPGGAA